jgi:hypothetical protein
MVLTRLIWDADASLVIWRFVYCDQAWHKTRRITDGA